MIVCLSVQSNADEAVYSIQDMNSTEARLQYTKARRYEDTAALECITSRELATLLMTEWYEPFDPLFGALAGNFVAGMGLLVVGTNLPETRNQLLPPAISFFRAKVRAAACGRLARELTRRWPISDVRDASWAYLVPELCGSGPVGIGRGLRILGHNADALSCSFFPLRLAKSIGRVRRKCTAFYVGPALACS